MKYFLKRSACFILLAHALFAGAQTISPALLNDPWKASWITVPGESANGYGIYLFRKTIDLASAPATFLVHVSADNRYKLYINDELVSLGPARGDIEHWNFETVNIAAYLKAGKNSIAAKVWNDGEWRPEGQISYRTGFILQSATDEGQLINTDTSWKCIRDNSYRPIRISIPTYYVAGPGEFIDMDTYIRNWEKPDYDDQTWKKAQIIFKGMPKNFKGNYGVSTGWMLTPSVLPQMERNKIRLAAVRKSEGAAIPASFPATQVSITIPANTTATLLLDQQMLVNAYSVLAFSGGKNGTLSLSYAESLYTTYPAKGNRDETEGKQFIGRRDSILSDGSNGQLFTSLTWRTYRYLQLRVATREDPLVIDDIYGIFTGYPFEYAAKLQSEQNELSKILEIGWRTARLCAVETYMDCPYYEQLQYIADARIQALVSLYNSGDDRLLKNALNVMDNSRRPEGVTLSRHPSYTPQYIPTFSLWYIGMLHDYWMYGNDSNFIRDKLAGEREVLGYFKKYQQKDGSLINVPYWLFTDWVTSKGWEHGEAPVGSSGASALLDLQLLMAYQVAADMEEKAGIKAYASLYRQYAAQLKKTIRAKYWDQKRKLFADRPEKDLFSQHANALAILTEVVEKNEMADIAGQLISDATLTPASIYFKYYLHRALIKAGLGNKYLDWLGKWRENISMGLTTWAETSDINTSRSDCHAWGSSPNIELFRTVLGIDSDAPGFSRVRIEPHPGELTAIGGEIPHPKGKLSVQYTKKNDRWTIEIKLPADVKGSFVWKGKWYLLKSGSNSLVL